MSELSETFLGLVLRNLNKFLSGILFKSKILLLKLNGLAEEREERLKFLCLWIINGSLVFLFGLGKNTY